MNELEIIKLLYLIALVVPFVSVVVAVLCKLQD
jgi:hypothetical protein